MQDFKNIKAYLDQFDFQFEYQYSPTKEIKEEEISQILNEYWLEIIYRYHASCFLTLLRTRKWLESFCTAYEKQDFYLFCVALRGLVESCSDSFYTLGRATKTIANMKSKIELILLGQIKDQPIISSELEERLIHFIFACRVNKPEKVSFPKSHQSEQIQTYLCSTKSEEAKELYAKLCQISHPSFDSINIFLRSNNENHIQILPTSPDREMINEMLDEYKYTIGTLINLAITPAISGLRIINLLNVQECHNLKISEDLLLYLDTKKYWESLEVK